MNKKFIVHFQTVDPILYSLCKKYPSLEIIQEKSKDYFRNLCREIIGQQLSGRVADVLFDRFKKLFAKKNVTPQAVLKMSEETLRKGIGPWTVVALPHARRPHPLEKF